MNERGKDYTSLLLHLCLSITGQTSSFNRSDRPARNPCANTGQTGPQTGQTGPNKTDRVHTLLLDLPPLCIPADELDTTGAEVDGRVCCNKKN